MARKKNKQPATNVGYEGIVKISIKSGNTILETKYIHNIGTKLLFLNIARAMYSQENFNIPRYLLLANSVIPENNPTITGIANNEINQELGRFKLDGRGIVNDDPQTGSYTLNWVASAAGEILNINTIGLTASGAEGASDILAYIKLSDSNRINIESGKTLIVEWSMAFSNK